MQNGLQSCIEAEAVACIECHQFWLSVSLTSSPVTLVDRWCGAVSMLEYSYHNEFVILRIAHRRSESHHSQE